MDVIRATVRCMALISNFRPIKRLWNHKIGRIQTNRLWCRRFAITWRRIFFQIKTLRLATSYISYLTGVLETDDPAGGFRAELGSLGRKNANNLQIPISECSGDMTAKTEISVSNIIIQNAMQWKLSMPDT